MRVTFDQWPHPYAKSPLVKTNNPVNWTARFRNTVNSYVGQFAFETQSREREVQLSDSLVSRLPNMEDLFTNKPVRTPGKNCLHNHEFPQGSPQGNWPDSGNRRRELNLSRRDELIKQTEKKSYLLLNLLTEE